MTISCSDRSTSCLLHTCYRDVVEGLIQLLLDCKCERYQRGCTCSAVSDSGRTRPIISANSRCNNHRTFNLRTDAFAVETEKMTVHHRERRHPRGWSGRCSPRSTSCCRTFKSDQSGQLHRWQKQTWSSLPLEIKNLSNMSVESTEVQSCAWNV